ncbi:MAG: EAL domain-containing protein [Peptostreptococcales bacterium]
MMDSKATYQLNLSEDLLFESHSSIMLVIDPEDGQIVKANEAAILFYGYSREKFLSMNIYNINILSKEQIKEEMDRAQRQKRNYFEFTHRLANGEERDVEVHSFPVSTEKRTLLFSVINDISDKIRQKLMFDRLFFASPYAVAILDKEQKVVNINENFTSLFKYSLEDVEGKPINILAAPSENKTDIDRNIELMYKGKVIKKEGVRKRKDGSYIEVEVLGYPIIYNQGVVGVYTIYIDITNRKAHEKQLLLFKSILENNSEGVVITNSEGQIEWINSAFTKIAKYRLEEIKQKGIGIIKSSIHTNDFYQDIWLQLQSEGQWSGEIWWKNKDKANYCAWVTINSIKKHSENTTYYVLIFKDLSEKKRIDRRINELQKNDLLTGFLNRDYFLKAINENHIKKGMKEFLIVIISVEGLEEINDSLGYLVRDRVLIEISKRILALTNNADLIARYDSDKFAILSSKLSPAALKDLAINLVNRIKKPFIIGDRRLYIKANIGISRFPENGTDVATLIRYADIALSKAREQFEENICFYSMEMAEETENKFYISNYLPGAMANKELSIHFQPIYDIKKSVIVGAEALLRWESPILGKVLPGNFIPIAEKTGQIVVIGEWVIKEVCKLLRAWNRKGYGMIPISINISVKQLEQMGFSKIVKAILFEYDVNPENIELEITESVSSGNMNIIIENLKDLKRSGIKISMDDFGTGFSSLGQLDLFGLDKLKIDKIFINDLTTVSKKQKLVKTIIGMANSLDLLVVAEGIETDEQLFYLKQIGCELGQGYLFSKPLPVNEMEVIIKGIQTKN